MSVTLTEGGGNKVSYVVTGAIVSCSLGSSPARLTLPTSHGVYLKGKAQMNVNDYVPIQNIGSFGVCKGIVGCQPALTMPWLFGHDDVLVDYKPALLSRCMNHCLSGGTIRIVDDGQTL